MLLLNIKELAMIVPQGTTRLAGQDMLTGHTSLSSAWLRISSDGKIENFGSMVCAPEPRNDEQILNLDDRCVLPCFCDSHTHIIYPAPRHDEWLGKIQGLTYEEIARRGGGILNSADRLAESSEEKLFEDARRRAMQMIAAGTGAMEIKTGYGLDTPNELKMLRVAARLREELPANVKITFLGAHAVGRKYTGRIDEYVEMLLKEMLPAVAAEGIADYVDVFCDEGFFTPAHTQKILEAAARYGLKPKIHANELAISGGVQVGVRNNAVSVDHLERTGAEEIECLAASSTIPTMLPGASFFSNLPYGNARAAVDAGLPLALASDYNPGSSPSGDMRMVWALACMKMKLLPREALAACTLNGAAAMELSHETGAITPGARANLIITKHIADINYIPYAYTEPWIDKIILDGNVIFG